MGKLTDEEKIEIVAKYRTGGYTIRGLGAAYGVSGPSICSLIKRRSQPVRENHVPSHKYVLAETYFDTIGPNQAYFLGLLVADGNQHKCAYRVRISLQEHDKSILEKFATELKTDRPLRLESPKAKHPTWQDMYILEISSPRLARRLNDLGVIPNKTFVTSYPDWLDATLDKHFIRGLIDGGGWIYNQQNNSKAVVGLVGTESLISAVSAKFSQYLETKGHICPTSRSAQCWRLVIGGRVQSRQVCEWLYKDAPIYMERKYQKAMELLANCPYHKQSLEGRAYLAANTTGENKCEF